ncbi:uncharacterized protein K452DRAFT_308466 [Aplosporella prunicola CBS 121167]|uniref:Uncharacterized protein n=1 Tax=Aplosporella prunicola CBS 121167 TaxID=1176127 RepID=A0A6A6BHP3_9PEZI|nr:uncharacterized protein K452DRAFT_308466 [Aplosporella prunicola CBS 121167]KAF2142071.1 hypothetical protein K452DRAFT_308466 [Aplosporella prunicola CBS 121167]
MKSRTNATKGSSPAKITPSPAAIKKSGTTTHRVSSISQPGQTSTSRGHGRPRRSQHPVVVIAKTPPRKQGKPAEIADSGETDGRGAHLKEMHRFFREKRPQLAQWSFKTQQKKLGKMGANLVAQIPDIGESKPVEAE